MNRTNKTLLAAALDARKNYIALFNQDEPIEKPNLVRVRRFVVESGQVYGWDVEFLIGHNHADPHIILYLNSAVEFFNDPESLTHEIYLKWEKRTYIDDIVDADGDVISTYASREQMKRWIRDDIKADRDLQQHFDLFGINYRYGLAMNGVNLDSFEYDTCKLIRDAVEIFRKLSL